MISAINQIAIKKVQESRELLNILKSIEKETSLLEALMVERLKLFFAQLESQIIDLVEENDLLIIGLHNLVDDLIADNFEDYYEIISKYNKKAWEHGQVSTSLLIDHTEASLKQYSHKANINVDTDDLFKPSTRVNEIIRTRNFQSSEKTMQRINANINKVLQDSYNEGWGVPKTTANLKNEFNKLKTWEARRIARTEINSAKNTAAYQQLIDDDIEYHQWWSASDKNVRDSHQEMHGLITKVGNPFPNGLLYPGDRSGPIAEWINCRCTPLAFIVPYGMMVPPGLSVFHESDLILINEEVDFNRNDYVNYSDDLGYSLDDLENIYELPKNITKEEISTAWLYSEEGYIPINAYNRRVPNYKEILKEHNLFETDIKVHNKYLDKLTSRMFLGENTVLYRGESGLYIEPKVNSIYKWDSFTSISFDKSVGVQYSQEQYIYKIYAPKGTKGIFMAENKLSAAVDEIEWLLSRNTEFKVLSYDKNKKIIEILLL